MFVGIVGIIAVIGILAFVIFALNKKKKGEDLGERNQP
jgi:hypothetical protein